MDKPSPRSGFVTTIAWIFIVLGALLTCLTLAQSLMLLSLDTGPTVTPGGLEGWAPGYVMFLASHAKATFLMLFAGSLLLLGTAIGVLRRRSLARQVFLGLLTLGAFWNVWGVIVQIDEILSPSPKPSLIDSMPTSDNEFFFLISFVWQVFMAAVLAWLVWRFSSQKVTAEFRRP